MGNYVINTYPTEDVFYYRLAVAANGNPQQFIYRVKLEDGEFVWIQMFASQERSVADRRVYVEMRDITRHYECIVNTSLSRQSLVVNSVIQLR